MAITKMLAVVTFITLLGGLAFAQSGDTVNHAPKHHHQKHHHHAASGITANDRNEYAHERNLRLSGEPTTTARGNKRISDDSVREEGDASMSRNGTGVFEDHHVSGVSR